MGIWYAIRQSTARQSKRRPERREQWGRLEANYDLDPDRGIVPFTGDYSPSRLPLWDAWDTPAVGAHPALAPCPTDDR